MRTERENGAYDAGRRAWSDGVSVRDNPYIGSPDDDLRIYWQFGWLDALSQSIRDPVVRHSYRVP